MTNIVTWLNGQPLFVHIILGVAAFNVFLTGLHSCLALIKDKTATTLDNKADSVVMSILSVSQKILDAVGFNPQHVDSPAPAAVAPVVEEKKAA